ncbi:MFS transporter [Microvirga aerilata]|uniref:MFS transporter n=1 Tax=Microvirga aerilata TaxID=670292 RepID=A0A936ZAY6_9HYPH|nr:MFS transporter [Microvirga aerilata]MBL0403542.1 MFS transporter [Microvirga aerilata]
MSGAVVEVAAPSIWRQQPFWNLFVPAIGVGLEQQIVFIALPLLVYQATASTIEMNLVRGLGLLPNLLLAFVIGAIVDQADKKSWLVLALAAQAACLCGLALAFQQDNVQPALTYPLIFFLSTAIYAYYNAQTVALKMALRQEDLGPATAALSSIGQAFQMLGPALAGLLLMLPSPSASLWAAAIVALLGFAAVLRLKLPHAVKNPGERLGVRIAEGWEALQANRPLWLLTLVVIVTNSAAGMFSITMLQKPQAAGLSGAQIGLMFSVAGGIGVTGALLAPRVRQRFTMGGACLLGLGFVTLCYAAASLASHPVTLTAILACDAFFGMIYNVMTWTLRQETTPTPVIGRVTGMTGSLFKLAMPFAIVAAGLLSEQAGMGLVFLASAALNGAMLVAFWLTPALRNLK